MKYTAPALANERFGVKFFTPHEPRYYRATHRRERVECLWLEVKRLGHVFCYPFLIYDRGRVYDFGDPQNPANAEKNEALIKRWNEIITPENLSVDWNWQRVEEDAFKALAHSLGARVRDYDDEEEDEDGDGEQPALDEGEPSDADEASDEGETSVGNEPFDEDEPSDEAEI